MSSVDIDQFKVLPGQKISLTDIPARGEELLAIDKAEAKKALKEVRKSLAELQRVFYAEHKHSLLIVLQGMDTSGKDSTVRHVFRGMNPQGIHVTSFKKPTEEETSHDYLWRAHARAPRRGSISIFNRSHYEDVLVARVAELVPQSTWRKRYEHIQNFEQMLGDEGTSILKFYLHIDKEKQREKIQERLDRPEKRWKFTKEDLESRQQWDEFQKAYEEAIEKTSTPQSPWYIVPSNQKWARNIIIASVIEKALKAMKLELPKPELDLNHIELK